MNSPYSMQESNNGPLCEFRWQVRTFTRPIAKVTGQTISSLFPLCPRILGYTIHALKDLVQAKQLLFGGLVSKASGDFVPEVWDRNVGV